MKSMEKVKLKEIKKKLLGNVAKPTVWYILGEKKVPLSSATCDFVQIPLSACIFASNGCNPKC